MSADLHLSILKSFCPKITLLVLRTALIFLLDSILYKRVIIFT